LRGRCYGRNVDEVVRNAGAFNTALRKQGIASCGKHFPGYSAATLDAHHELPKITRTRDQLDRAELAVFRALIRKIDSMMICHGWYPIFEGNKKPASLSHRIVGDLLRKELGFEGLIMTDDLDMGAIVNEYSLDDTIRLTIEAGNDLAMICHRVAEIANAYAVLEKLPRKQIDQALARVARLKKSFAPPHKFSESAFSRINEEIWELRVAVLGEEQANSRSAEDGKRSPVELY